MNLARITVQATLVSCWLLACNKQPDIEQTPASPAAGSVPAARPEAPAAPAAAPEPPSHAATKAPENAQAPAGMVHVSGGSFDMGLPREITQGEGPKRTEVQSFLIDRTEVTVEAYLACVRGGQCTPSAHQAGCNATAKKPLLDHTR